MPHRHGENLHYKIVKPDFPRIDISLEGRLPGAFGIARKRLAEAARFFAAKSASRSGRPFAAVSVVLQDDAGSDEAHRAVMDVEGATDGITQPVDPMPGEKDGVYGELYVNCDRALCAAPKRAGWSPLKELLLYIAHGMDHLSGADDRTPRERASMRRRELGWVGKFLPIVLAAFLALPSFAYDLEEEVPFDRYYVSAGASLVLPQGGAKTGRLGGGKATAGWYATEFTALEGSFSILENRYAASAGLLWHWYGYERLDPFFICGGSWIEGAGAGPSGGVGFYWHLDDHWSLRFDCAHALLVDGGVDSAFFFSAALRVTW